MQTYNSLQGQHKFCGFDEEPFDYYSVGKSLTITFKSFILTESGIGFKLEYRTAGKFLILEIFISYILHSSGCNRNYTSLQGRIFSSNDKSNCIITITVPENRTISLYFQKMVISHSYNCKTSAFEVRCHSYLQKKFFFTFFFRLETVDQMEQC